MNAVEARQLSNCNAPKLIEKNFNDSVLQLNQKIKASAKNGEFSANITISLPGPIGDEVLNQMESHYKSDGYEVKVKDFLLSKMFMVSWQK